MNLGDKELESLPKEALVYLGLIDEAGNPITNKPICDEEATQVLATPTQKMAIVNPVGEQKELPEGNEEEPESLKQTAEKLPKEAKKSKLLPKKESLSEDDLMPEDDVDVEQEEGILLFDILSDWCVALVEGFSLKLIDADELFECFSVDLGDGYEVVVSAFCDGTVKTITTKPNARECLICCPQEGAEEHVKQKILSLYNEVLKNQKEDADELPYDFSSKKIKSFDKDMIEGEKDGRGDKRAFEKTSSGFKRPGGGLRLSGLKKK